MFKTISRSKALMAIVVTFLTFVVLGKSLGFGLWRDDWLYVWVLETAKDPSLLVGTKIWVSYPLIYLRLLLLSFVLGSNPLHWQVSNLIFRVLSILGSGTLVEALFKNKKVTLLSMIFMSVAVGGVESATFLGANNVMFFISILTFGIYLWIKSSEKHKNVLNRTYLFAVILLGFLAKGEQWSYYVIPLVALTWDVILYISEPGKVKLKHVVTRNGLLWAFLLGLFFLPPNGLVNDNGLAKLMSIQKNEVPNIFASMGNLWLGSFVYIPESAGLSSFHETSMFVGVCLFAATITLGVYFLFRPAIVRGRLLFLLVWMWILYLPNWVFEAGLVVGASHRYLAASSLALYTILAYFLLKSRKRVVVIVSLTFIALNVYINSRILSGLDSFRNASKISQVVEAMNSDIPAEQKDFVVLYAGDGAIRGYILDWSLGIPLAIKRDIVSREQFPIWIGDVNKAVELVCGRSINVNLIGRGERYLRGGYKYSLEQIHSYYVHDNGNVDILSDTARQKIEEIKDCTN